MTIGIKVRTYSKSQFKPKALEVMRLVEQTGESVIITDNGKPTLELKIYHPAQIDPLDRLRGSVMEFQRPTDPIGDDLWDAVG